MLILTIRTDNPTAEIGLYEDKQQLSYETWEAHRELSVTIHTKVEGALTAQHKDWSDITGVVCFAGPGSFTGLRIGLSVGNALAYGESAAIVSQQGEQWIETGIDRLLAGDSDPLALPHYGGEAHITKPKH